MLKLADETPVEKKPEEEIGIPKGYFLIPLEDLPSKGRVYPVGTKIMSRPLKVLELKHLAYMTEASADMVIDNVLQGSVLGIDVRDLVVADKIFIIMWQRTNTYKGDKFSIQFRCQECGEEGEYEFSVDKLSVDDVVDDYSLDREYEIGEHKYQLDQPRVRDVERTKDYLEKNPDVDIDILTSVAYRIWKIDGQKVDIDTAYKYVLDMNPGDFVELNSICAKTEMKINPVVNVTCKSCGKEVPQRVTFRSDFFIPSIKH